MGASSENVSFRLKQELLRKLDQQRDPFGDSRGEYARRLVIAELNGVRDESLLNQFVEFRQLVAAIDDEIHVSKVAFKDAIQKLTFVMLTSSDGLPAAEAKQIAQRVVGTVTE